MTYRYLVPLLALSLLMALPAPRAAQEPPAAEPVAPTAVAPWVELHRIRVVNRKDGAIQVSTDAGATWSLIGRVVAPATTAAEGYLAMNYADPGTVSATAVHGLRLRISGDDPTLHSPLTLAINPREYRGAINKGYGGHRAGSAGIYTDIPAGTSLFRNLAPYVGNPLFRQTDDQRLLPLPRSFRPRGEGETLVIVVQRPRAALVEVVFENRAGGAVTGRFSDGTTREITRVVQPVKGVGRFDGTAYTGVGRINTAHSGVVTVSTAPVDAALPEGEGKERRGGFQISPAWHNARTEEAGAPMVMTLGTPGPRRRELEGNPPLFRDMIPLANGEGARVDVAIDGGAWEPMPSLVGAKLDAFTGPGLTRVWKARGGKRAATRGVTAFRLHIPLLTPGRSRAAATTAAAQYQTARLAAARAGRLPLVTGTLTINANPTNAAGVVFVRFSVEGAAKGFTNRAPFTLSWDTTRVPNGEYLVEAEAIDGNGRVLATTRRLVYVQNGPAPVRPGVAER